MCSASFVNANVVLQSSRSLTFADYISYLTISSARSRDLACWLKLQPGYATQLCISSHDPFGRTVTGQDLSTTTGPTDGLHTGGLFISLTLCIMQTACEGQIGGCIHLSCALVHTGDTILGVLAGDSIHNLGCWSLRK